MPKEKKGSSLDNSLIPKRTSKLASSFSQTKMQDPAGSEPILQAQAKRSNIVKKKTHGNNIPITTSMPHVKETITRLKKEPLNLYATYQAKTKNPVYTGYSKLDEIRLITVGLASSNRILQWAEKSLPNGKIVGEVTNANTLHHKTFKPVKGGLFCERIFGPLKDFECACSSSLGKKMKNLKKAAPTWASSNMQGDLKNTLAGPGISNSLSTFNGKRFFCPACDVEYTWSVIRRYQLGYIKLNAPVTHVWYVKGNPSYISLLLDMKKKHVEYVTYCTETLTLENSLKFSVENLYTLSETGLEAQPNELYAAWEKVSGSSVKPTLEVNGPASMTTSVEKFQQTSFSNSNKPFTKSNFDFGDSNEVSNLRTNLSKETKTLVKDSSKALFVNRLPHRSSLGNGLKPSNYYLISNSIESKSPLLLNKKTVFGGIHSRPSALSEAEATLQLQTFNACEMQDCISHHGKTLNTTGQFFENSFKNPKQDKESVSLFKQQKSKKKNNLYKQRTNKQSQCGLKTFFNFMQTHGLPELKGWKFDKVSTNQSYSLTHYKKSELEASLKLQNLVALVAVKNSNLTDNRRPCLALATPRTELKPGYNTPSNYWFAYFCIIIKNLKKLRVASSLRARALARVQHAFKLRLMSKSSFTNFTNFTHLPESIALGLTRFSEPGYASPYKVGDDHLAGPTLQDYKRVKTGQRLKNGKAIKLENLKLNSLIMSKYKLLIYLLLNDLKETSLSMQNNPAVLKHTTFSGLENFVASRTLAQTFKFKKISFLSDFTLSESIIFKLNAMCKPALSKTNKKVTHFNNLFLSTLNFANLIHLVFLLKNTLTSVHLKNTVFVGQGQASIQQKADSFYILPPNKELASSIWQRQNKVVSNLLFMNRLANYILKKTPAGPTSWGPKMKGTGFSNSLTNVTFTGFYNLVKTNIFTSARAKASGYMVARDPASSGPRMQGHGQVAGLKYQGGKRFLTSLENYFALNLRAVNHKTSLIKPFSNDQINIFGEHQPDKNVSFTETSIKASIFNSVKLAQRQLELHKLIKQPQNGLNDLTKLVNNIYCLSHRLLWDNEKDWQFFAFYYYGFYSFIKNVPSLVTETPSDNKNSGVSGTNKVNKSVPGTIYRQPLNLEDTVVPIYAYRNYSDHFSLLNTFFSRTSSLQGSIIQRLETGKENISATPTQLHVSFSGAGMIKTLLADFHYLELKKMDKQNRILLYDLNKYIRKMKKQITQNKKLVKAVKELCKQRDILIRRTKYIRKIFRNYVNFSLPLKSQATSSPLTTQSASPTAGLPSTMQPKQRLSSFYPQETIGFNKTQKILNSIDSNTSLNNMGRLADLILEVLPVLPPDLRPIVKMGSQIAASDLNRLYQRVIYRNDRLKKFLKNPATNGSYEMKYAQRLLQESVDNLIQNGKSGVVPEKDARGRSLKSLSDILKGKQGRFRQYLLGKRVDYSGRSVIVVGPKLKLHECGIPKEMALELYLPFLIKSILNKNLARTVIGAKALIQNNKPLTWSLLREILKTCPVLLNRAPTLHRLGFQAFQPKLVDGRAILLHPLVCPAFNADFDGDQMAVHVPISAEARAEAWKLMLSRNNLLSPATGEPLVLPSQDMVLGCYYLTTNGNKFSKEFEKGFGFYFDSLSDVLRAYNQGLLSIHAIIWVKWNAPYEQVSNLEAPLEIRLNTIGSGGYIIYPKSYKTFIIQKKKNPVYLQLQNPHNQTMDLHPRDRGCKDRQQVAPTAFLNHWVPGTKTDPSRKWATELILVNNVIRTTPGKILFNVMLQNSLTPYMAD